MFIKRMVWTFSTLLLVLTLCLLQQGCGSSLLGESKVDVASLSPKDQLKQASSTADYQDIVTRMDSILSSSTASKEKKQEAYAVKGEAQMGVLGISPLTLVSSVAGSSNINLIQATKVSATLAQLTIAAESLNTANALIGTLNARLSHSIQTQAQTVPALSSNQQLSRGVSNLYVVISMITGQYSISSSSTQNMIITPVDSTSTAAFRVAKLASTASVRGISYYADQAISGITLSGALKSDQQASLTKVQTATSEVNNLNTAIVANTAYTYKGISYNVQSGTNQDSEIDKALLAILKL